MEFIRVFGKAQNRTALGIMHAYLLLNPKATLQSFRSAFPNSLNPDRGVDEVFIYATEKGTTANWDGFFKGDDEVLTLADGSQIAVVKMWTKPSLERLVEKAKAYGIVVAEFTEADKGFAKKGGFRLEYLNGWVPTEAKKTLAWWLWVLILVALAAVGAYFLSVK